jgi:hypothetical protein
MDQSQFPVDQTCIRPHLWTDSNHIFHKNLECYIDKELDMSIEHYTYMYIWWANNGALMPFMVYLSSWTIVAILCL